MEQWGEHGQCSSLYRKVLEKLEYRLRELPMPE